MSLIVTSGLGYGGGIPGGGFLLTSVIPASTSLDLAFTFALAQISGPAADPSQYAITPLNGGAAVTIQGAALVGGNVRLTTTEFTNGKNYRVTLPWASFNDGNSDIFQGPFFMDFVAVGTAPFVVMARSVDARLMEVVYSEAMLEVEALNPANYSINNGLTVSAVVKVTDVIYRLTTSRQIRDQAYSITVTNVHDQHGNLIT
jgi:hypothetical protein